MSRICTSLNIGKAFGLSALLLATACGGDNSSDDGDRGSGGKASGGSPSAGSSGEATSGGKAAGGTSGGTAGGGAGAGGPSGGSGGAVACTTATGEAADTLVYDGNTDKGTCATGIAAPRTGYWFSYGDMTTGATKTGAPESNGRGGATDCAYHITGSGYADYGAGAGFDLNFVGSSTCPYDASAYTGIRAYLKGTTTGTRGMAYALTPNSVRLKLVTTDASGGDDFGGWCTLSDTDWTACEVTFATASREGWNMDYTATELDPTKLTKVQFEFPKESMQAEIEFDVWIDDIEFF